MATGLSLLLHVREVKVELSPDVELFINATVNGVSKKTPKQSSRKTQWSKDLQFQVQKIVGAMKVELIASSVEKKQLLGFASIPLYTIRHTNKSSKGAWSMLHTRSVNGELVASDHALRLDAHFQLPKDIPENELKMLEEKLMACSDVLWKEAKILEDQHLKLKTKHLPLPEKGQGTFSYPKMSSSESIRLDVPPPMFHIRDSTPSSITSSGSENSLNASEKETSSVARNRWKKAVAHPKFQEKMTEMMKEANRTSKKGFNPAILELVSHLQGLEKCELRKRSGPNRRKTMSAMNQIRSRLYHRKSREELAGVAKHTIDEDVRIHVYQTALATLLYPVSKLHHHQFEEKSFKSPTYCRECEGFIYGMTRQGYQCKRCGKTCHKRCVASARPDCFHIKSTNASFTEAYLAAINEVIETTLKEGSSMFFLMREAFNVDQIENKTLIHEVTTRIRHYARDFSATISIKVMAAQGLATHILSDPINLYVSLDVGGVRKRTKPFKSSGPPSWNEEFKFECNNMLEPIKARVWNERHNTWGKLSQKLTSESDVFLGQKIMEVMTLGVGREIWFTLEKRTDNNIVSGSIKLKVSCVIAGEFHVVSFHKMYSLLHEQLFLYEHVKQLNDMATLTEKVNVGKGSVIRFFNSESQMIVDGFAKRFAVEPVFRLMVHLKLLVDHSSYVSHAYSVLITTAELIKNQLLQFAAEQNSILGLGIQRMMQEVFSASNFGKDNFARCLDKLMAQLKVELQQYRLLYPVDDSQRLKDFESNVKLIKTVMDLQVQLMGMDPRMQAQKYKDVIESCMLECVRQTFDDVVQQTVPEEYEGHPGMQPSDKPYEFFYSLLDGMESMEYEDRTIYGPLVQNHCDIVLGDLVALTIWDLFKTIIQDVFQVEEHLTVFPPMEAIHLLLTVKDYYEKHTLPAFPKGNVPDLEYPHWFQPAVIFWIEDFQKKTNDVIKNAWEIDKKSNFEPQNEEKFSSSSFDMIDYFHKGYQVTKRFDEGVEELRHSYNLAYARVVKASIVHYCDMVSGEITNQSAEDIEVTCMLLNNIQFLRYGVETLYSAMGGQEGAGESCSEELKELQGILGRQVNSWCKYVGKSIKDDIWEGVQEVQQEILKLKGQGQLAKHECKFAPLLDRLFKYCKTFRDSCQEKTVLPKLINRIWIIVVHGIHNMLLPPLPGIPWDDVEESLITFTPHSYSSKQCAAVNRLLDYLKDFFEDDSLGVKEQTLVGNVKQFKVFTKLYQQTTDALVAEFMKDFAAKAKYDGIESSGEVSLEVSAYRHPATGEFDGSIRVISARDLREFKDVQVLKPQIELNLIVPGAQNASKFKYVATTKEPSTSPSFNQTFKFVLPPNSMCELEITAKHKAYIGGSRMIGVAVLPLKTALQSDMHTIDLNNHLPFTDFGRVLLTILAQRTHDEIAKEFVELKTQSRTGDK